MSQRLENGLRAGFVGGTLRPNCKYADEAL
jgi:hypothetical protein